MTPAFVPIFVLLMWLSVTTIGGLASGWFRLQQRFPASDEVPLRKLRMRTGWVNWARFGGILSFAACRSGLRVAVWPLFGPFTRPFEVPWSQIEAEPVRILFSSMVQLRLGHPEAGRLAISEDAWRELTTAARQSI